MKDPKKQFYKNVYSLFPIHKAKEKNYLKNLKIQIEQCDVNTYDELENIFGTPIDIVKAYYDTINSEYLIKAIQVKKIVRYTCILIITIALCISIYVIYLYNQAYKDFHKSVPDNYYEVIEEIE